MAMGNEICLEQAGLQPGEIFTDSIRQWRANCQNSNFTIGASIMRGKSLEMELIGASISEGEFFSYSYQKWLAILFVDPDGIIGSILFKTESLDNFEELRRSYYIKGQSLLGKTIRANMSKRASKSGNSYYAVEFEVISDGKYAEAIAQFRQLHYSPQMFPQLESPVSTTDSSEKDVGETGAVIVDNGNRNRKK